MKKLLILCTLLFSLNAYGLSCVSPEDQRANAKNAYMIEILSIDNVSKYEERPNPEHRTLVRNAKIKVHKIYKGDVEYLSELIDIEIKIGCVTKQEYSIWGEPVCELLEDNYGFAAGDKKVIFNDKNEIYSGLCSFANISADTNKAVKEFEKEYPPIWEWNKNPNNP